MWIFPVRKPFFQHIRQHSPFPVGKLFFRLGCFHDLFRKFAHWYSFKVLLCHINLPLLFWKATFLIPLLLNVLTLNYRRGVSEMMESDSLAEPQRPASQRLLKTTQERVFLSSRGTIRGSGSTVVWLICAVSCWASGLHMKAVSLMCAGHWGGGLVEASAHFIHQTSLSRLGAAGCLLPGLRFLGDRQSISIIAHISRPPCQFNSQWMFVTSMSLADFMTMFMKTNMLICFLAASWMRRLLPLSLLYSKYGATASC